MKRSRFPWNLIIVIAVAIGVWYFRYSLPAALLLAALGLMIFLLINYLRKPKKDKTALPTLTKEREAHYEKIGMSDTEIAFFRDTMNTAKAQIVKLQENMNRVAKLKAIDLRNDTVRISKAMFKEIVKEPEKLHSANHFLYTHLPNLVELTDKYIEIDNHEIKNKQTYEKLEESSLIIDQVSKLILKDYEQFVSDDLEDMDIEMSVAKNSLKRDNEDN